MHRARPRPGLKPGDDVVRRRRALKTRGSVLRLAGDGDDGGSRVWVKWDHPTTIPNPSLEAADDLELAEATGDPERQP